jgi:gamma-glutamyltranspeptidase/glutathione hydrolase
MVAASNPLAAEAGLEILKQGGNAVDAAIAVSGALTDSDADSSGTVYFAVADGERNMVSYIQSNYMGFGSGLVVPGAGISLQNRGHTFSLDPARANCLKPGKKTYHTIIPGFLTKGGQAVGPFVVMGGFMQPQGHLQFITNSIDYNMNPQAALDVPRWQWIKGKTVKVEQNFPDFLVSGLARRGHNVQVENSPVSFGRGQSIWRHPETGVLVGATESRADGTVAAW